MSINEPLTPLFFNLTRLTGSGRVFSRSGIWPKYSAGFGKTRQKNLDGKWDLTATREALLTKIWTRDEEFFACLSGIREIVRSSCKCKSIRRAFSGVSFLILSPSSFPPPFSLLFIILRYESLFPFCKGL